MSDLSEQVMDALTKLGPTSLDIAQSLQNKGIRAQVRKAEACAITVYIREQFPELPNFTTGTYSAGTATLDVPLNIHQRAFIEEFDQGYYPDLIA